MPEKYIPSEAKNFSATIPNSENEIPQSNEILTTEKIIFDFDGLADDMFAALEQAEKGVIPQSTQEDKAKADSGGILSDLSKRAGKWGKGIIAAAMIAGAERASADWTQADEQRISDIEKNTQKSMDRMDQEIKREQAEQNKQIDELKKLIIDSIERKYPNSKKIVEKHINILIQDTTGLTFLERINALDEFGKSCLAKLGGEKTKKTYSNDWKGEVDKRADEAQESMDRLKDVFKKFYNKNIPYSEVIKLLEQEIEPGTTGQLNGLHFERKTDGSIYIQYMKVTQESRARLFAK